MYSTRSCFRPSYLVDTIRRSFQESLPPPPKKGYTATECTLSAFAMFHLKYPSLLKFDEACRDEDKILNIKSLYDLTGVPCDTTMRERLDKIDIGPVKQAIHDIIGVFQRSQALQVWGFMGTKRWDRVLFLAVNSL
ncbi:MAG: hypothetical protein WCG04_04435 [Alphaproteobacteria bacterium]